MGTLAISELRQNPFATSTQNIKKSLGTTIFQILISNWTKTSTYHYTCTSVDYGFNP